MSSVNTINKKIIIVGGGFGGIQVALNLARQNLPDTKIILISDKPHFEYTPTLYRIVTGRSPLQVCLPLSEILSGRPACRSIACPAKPWRSLGAGRKVEITQDLITTVDLKKKELRGRSGSRYAFDFLILSLGSETAYFDIPGSKELSFGFKSINEALRLKRHLHEVFTTCATGTPEEQVCGTHIVIVGGGTTGVELAGELAVYCRQLAERHKLESSLVTVDLIEAASRLLPALPEDISEKVKMRLHHLGVNVFVNQMMIKEEVETVYLKDMEMKTKTVIWAAGIMPNHLYKETAGLQLDKSGRVLVDEFLQAKGLENVFVIGDSASTPYSGMAQVAISDAYFVTDVIYRKEKEISLLSYRPQKPFHAIPIGPGWAAVLLGGFRVYGWLGWWLRRLADFRYFLSILPLRKAIVAFSSSKTLCESCAICTMEEKT